MELAVIILFVLSIAVVSALWGRFEKRRAANPKPEGGASSGADGSAGARAARPARQRPSPAETGTSPQAARDRTITIAMSNAMSFFMIFPPI